MSRVEPYPHAYAMSRVEAYAHAYGKQVGHASPGRRARRGDDGTPTPLVPVLRNRPDSPLGRLARLLVHALGEHRYEPWNAYNTHRAYPSARSAFTVDAVVRLGDRRWTFDPVAIALCGAEPLADLPPGEPVAIELVLRSDRLPDSYGTLRDALGTLEAGHAAAAVIEAAGALGGTAHYEPVAGALGVIRLDTLPVGSPDPGRLRSLHRRSSGVAPFGLSAGSRRLSTLDFAVLTATPMPGLPSVPMLRQHAVVGAGGEVQPGRYAIGADGPTLVDPIATPDDVQAAFSYPRSDIDVAGMPLIWLFTGDVGAASTADPDGYRQLLVAAGAAAQHVGLAATTLGLFCRPCRSVDEARLESRLGLPADESLLYLLLVGAPRVHDFWFDLLPSLEALS